MKKAVTRGLFTIMMLAQTLAPALAGTYSIKIGGGPLGGTYNMFANGMAVFLPEVNPNIQAIVVGSDGSVENVKRIHGGDFDFGLCYAVDSALGYGGKLPRDNHPYNRLRSMGYLYGAPAHLVVRADSEFKKASDLEGARVAVGDAGSVAAAGAERFFRHIGVWDRFKPVFIGYSAAASAFKEGRIEAFWVLVDYPNPSVVEASVKVKIRLIDVGIEAEQSRLYDAFAFSPATIPADTYGKGMPASITFQDSTILCVNKDVPEDLVYTVMKTLWSKKGRQAMIGVKSTFKAMTLENNFFGAAVPLHPGAVKFWKEQGVAIPARLIP